MEQSGTKLLFVSPQPTQNVKPYRILAKTFNLLVAYCTVPDERVGEGEEQINRGVFDYDWRSGYRWLKLKNISPKPSFTSRWGQLSFAIVPLVMQHDIIVVYGHRYLTQILAIVAAKLFGKKLVLTTDATITRFSKESPLKQRLKRWVFGLLYYLAEFVCVPSTSSKGFLLSLGVPERKIVLTPYSVDEEFVLKQITQYSRSSARQELGLGEDRFIVLFVGKLIKRKRPMDLVKALRLIDDVELVIVGEGPLREEIEKMVGAEGLQGRVHVRGMANYSELLKYYVAADLLCHPAEEEPWGLIVNEAMLAQRPVIVSDAVGAGADLVAGQNSGWCYPVGQFKALAGAIAAAKGDSAGLQRMGERASEVVKGWSSERNAQELEKAIVELPR